MYVKVYSYHVQSDKVGEYLRIQQKAESIYLEYAKKTTLHLNSKEDSTKWIEIHQYENEEAYQEAIEKVNARSEIKELYEAFLNVLTNDNQVTEENYTLKEIGIKSLLKR